MIQVVKEDKVGYITLDRPDVYNSFNRPMALRLQEVLDDFAADKDIRAIHITGNGKAFSAGQDLGEIVDPDGPELQIIIREHYNPIVERLRAIEKPIVAAINGVAAGAGANIALACDITVAAESASFLQAFSKIGLIPDSGGTYTLPRSIGWQKASALMMLGEKLPATEAERIGMIYKVVPDTDLLETTKKIATKLAHMPTVGLGLTKRALNLSYENTLAEQLQVEDELQYKAGTTWDYGEGVNAFLEKRKPEFKGE